MSLALANAVLWTAAVILAAGILVTSWFISAVGSAFGRTRASPALQMATVVCLLLHAGVFLGPLWLQMHAIGVGLATMLPATVLDVIGGLFVLSRFETAPGGRGGLVIAAALLFMGAAIAAPVALATAA
jgi:hypothetical protein